MNPLRRSSARPRAHAQGAIRILALGLALTVTACAVGPKPQANVGVYDFGPPVAATATARVKALSGIEVSAPRWIDSVNAHYRLAYANAAQPQAYAQTRWVMPPPVLIDARLKERAVAGGTLLGGAGPLLKIEIDEFAQVFDAEKSSRAVLRARVTLQSGREVLRQRRFVIEEIAATADGPGGTAALARAADQLIESVLDWAGGA
jgi:cholesterol transport system auxiliary component